MSLQRRGKRGYSGDGGPAVQADLAGPHDLAFDAEGNLYFTDTYNHAIPKVDTRGIISTVAGTGEAGYSGDGGPALKAQLNAPLGVDVEKQGHIIVADTFNRLVRRIDTHGIITKIAASDPPGYGGGMAVPP